MVDEIESNLRFLSKQRKDKNIRINAHPYVEAFINKKTDGSFFSPNSLRKDWQKKYNRNISVFPTTSYSLLEYHFIAEKGEKIHL